MLKNNNVNQGAHDAQIPDTMKVSFPLSVQLLSAVRPDNHDRSYFWRTHLQDVFTFYLVLFSLSSRKTTNDVASILGDELTPTVCKFFAESSSVQ